MISLGELWRCTTSAVQPMDDYIREPVHCVRNEN